MKREELNKKIKAEYENYVKIFADLKEDKAKEYIHKNVYKVKISRELIAAYMEKYHPDDREWLKDAIISKPKYKNSAVVENGKVIYTGKKHKTTGKPLAKMERVFTGEMSKPKFDVPTARNLFIKRYGIEPLPTGYAKKDEVEKLFDPMENLLKDL